MKGRDKVNEIQAFNNEQFGQVRAITIDGEPWFVAADVCKALEIDRTASRRLDDDEKGVYSMHTPGGKQDITIINEPGLYSLVLGSRKPEARAFKRWITHEVIPSIRKHGMYATPTTVEGILNNPDAFIGMLQAYKAEKEKNKVLEEQAAINAPKVDFADALLVCDNCSYIEELAKQLCQLGMNTGRNRLIAEMVEDGFLCARNGVKNMPTQRCIESGWLAVERKPHNEGDRSVMGYTTKVTPSGMQHFMAYYMRKHGLMPLLTVARKAKRNTNNGYLRNKSQQ